MGVYFDRVKNYFCLNKELKKDDEGAYCRVCKTDCEICMQRLITVKIKLNDEIRVI